FLRTIHANSKNSSGSLRTSFNKSPGELGTHVRGELDRRRCTATHDEARVLRASNDSLPRLGCKLRGKPQQLSRTAAPDEPMRGRAYSEIRCPINPQGCPFSQAPVSERIRAVCAADDRMRSMACWTGLRSLSARLAFA